MSDEWDRRQFLAGAAALTGVPPLCCVTQPLPEECVSFQADTITVDLTRAAGLRKAGAAFSIVNLERKINLILIHASRGEFVAMDRSCTHGGAQCTYNPKRHTVQCTSLNHAEYDLQGTLLHGRTHGNLRRYPTRLSGTRIAIATALPS